MLGGCGSGDLGRVPRYLTGAWVRGGGVTRYRSADLQADRGAPVGCLIQGVFACRRSVQRGSGDLRSRALSSFTARTRCERTTAVGNGLARGEWGLGGWSHDYVMRTAWRRLSTVLCASPSWLRHRDPCDVVGEESQVTSAPACLRRRRAPLSMRWLMFRVLPSALCFPGRICWSGSAVLGSWGL